MVTEITPETSGDFRCYFCYHALFDNFSIESWLANSGLHGRRRPTINAYGFRLIQTELGSVVRWLWCKLYDLKKSEIHNLTERSLVINPKIYANLYYIQNRDTLTWKPLEPFEYDLKYTFIMWKVYDPKILKLNDHIA